MAQALFTLLGVSLGFIASLFLQFQRSRDEQRRNDVQFNRERLARLDNDRKAAYIAMLSAARELRFVARRNFESKVGSRTEEETDDLRTSISVAYYEIAILAPTATVELAANLRRAVFDYVNHSRDHPDDEHWENLRHAARVVQDAFEEQVRAELVPTAADMSG